MIMSDLCLNRKESSEAGQTRHDLRQAIRNAKRLCHDLTIHQPINNRLLNPVTQL